MIAAVMPALNEEKSISQVLEKVNKHVDNVIVVNDGSTDKTPEIAKSHGAIVLNHEKNMGLGASLRDGFRHAMDINADIIISIDSDGQHDPEEIPKLVEAVKDGNDFVLGQRDLRKYPLVKKIGNTFLNFMTNLISGTLIRDTESGFRAFSRQGMEKVYPYLKANGYEIASEIIFAVGYYNVKYSNVKVSSPVYVKGVTVKEGVKNFIYMMRRRRKSVKSYIADVKYVARKWILNK